MKISESTLGFVAGFAAGLVTCHIVLKSKYRARADEEIRQMRDYIQKKEQKIKEAEKEHSDWQEFEDIDENTSPANTFPSLVKAEEAKSAYIRYTTESNEAKEINKKEFDEMRERLENAEHPEEEHDAPYRLTIEEFEEGRPGYDTIGLAYYRGDGSLVDDSEELVDVEETVGEDNLEWFKHSSDDAMYIRNDQFGVDYEIVEIDGNFYDDIFSEGDE